MKTQGLLSGLPILAVAALGFVPAVPANAVAQAPKPAIQELMAPLGGGPEIGVTVRDVTPADAEGASPQAAGAVIESVRAESPAARAGLRAGDVVVVFDGENVRSARQLARLIDETPAERSVPLTVVRAGNRVSLSVAPEQRNPWQAVWPATPSNRENELLLQPRRQTVLPGLFVAPGAGRLGIQIQDLTPQLGEYFGTTSGVLVSSVADSTPARTAGLRAGDVITKVNGETVQDGAALRQRLASVAGATTLTVTRDRKEMTIEVNLPQSGTPAPVQRRRYTR
jgi:serine protease Do